MKRFIYGFGLLIILSGTINIQHAYATADVTTKVTTQEENTEGFTEEDTTEESTTEETTTEIIIPTETISAIYNLNNYVKNIDYKLSNSIVKSINNDAPQTDIIEDVVYSDTSQNLNNLGVAESWLIRNNYVSRAGIYNKGEFTFLNDDLNATFLKSELWMTLAKIGYGTINSRTLITNKERSDAYIDEYIKLDGSIVHADGSAGDYFTYVTPNVYELYFSKLLDAGLINKNEFATSKGKKFLKDYEAYSSNKSDTTLVPWVTSKGAAQNTSDSIFGYSTKQSDNGNKIVEKRPAYFAKEEIYTIDALKIIETFMRANEKEMTKMEASLVTYKYGIHYVEELSAEDQKTVEYLIAKGILNYEDPAEMVNIYGVLTRDIGYTLLYRVANPEARFDFSKITLTDQESFWQERGYFQNNINLYNASVIPTAETISSQELEQLKKDAKVTSNKTSNEKATEENLDNDFLDDILGFNIFKVRDVQAAQTNKYKIRKMFDTNYTYKYGGKDINDLEVKDEVFAIDDIKVQAESSGGSVKKSAVKVITFEVTAKDAVSALAYVNNKITADMSSLNKIEVSGYTTIEDTNGTKTTLISESSLRQAFTKISIVEDKLLVNTETGAEAVLLPDSGYALVGNQVIVSNDILVTNSNNEIYYNLDVIAAICTNSILTKLTTTKENNNDVSMYDCSSNIKSESKVSIKTENAVTLGTTTATKVKFKFVNDQGVEDKKSTEVWCYNVSQLDRGINTLIRQCDVKLSDGSVEKVTFVVDWNFVVLGAELINSDILVTVENSANSVNGLTVNDINKVLYTRPSDSAAAEWWDSNISMSNSLANFMYGTSGVKYVTNGWLAPRVTVLKSSNVSEALVAKIFKSNGFKLDSTGKKYCDNTSKFWESYFNNPKMTGNGLKELAKTYRTFNMYNSSKAKNGLKYNNEFYLTSYNVLYRAMQNTGNSKITKFDDRVKYAANSVIVQSRNNNGSIQMSNGQSFTYKGENWKYLGVKDGYFLIQPDFSISGKRDKGVLDGEWYPCLIKCNSNYYVYPFNMDWFVNVLNSSTWEAKIDLPANKTLADYCHCFDANGNSLQIEWTNNSKINEQLKNSVAYAYYKFDGSIATQIHSCILEYLEEEVYNVYFSGSTTPRSKYKTGDIFSYLENTDARALFKGTNYFYLGGDGFTNGTSSLGINYETFSVAEGRSAFNTIAGLPLLYISTSNYYFGDQSGSKVLQTGSLAASSNAATVSYTGLNRKVIDSIVAKFSSVCKVNDLKNGQRLYVGDILLTKTSSGFVSEPIKDVHLVDALKNHSKDPVSIRSGIVGLFIGQTILYSGNTCTLSSYIENTDIGNFLNTNTITDGVVWKDNSVVKIKNGNTDDTDLTKAASYACINFTFLDGLLAMPISADGSTYRLLTVSSISGNDYIDDIPFYTESLSFERHKDNSTTIGTTFYSIFQFFNECKESFKDMMNKAFNGDVVNIIWSIIYVFASYMCIIVWILYAMLKYDIGRKYFRILTMPASNGHGYRQYHGFDIIKLASLGIYDVNSEPTMSRTITTSFVCFFIMYSILRWIPR